MNAVPEEWLRALREAHFFHELGTTELRQVAELATEHHLSESAVLYEQGERAEMIHLLLEGLVHIPSVVGTRSTLLVSPPEVFGIAALVMPHRQLGTAITGTPCRLLSIPIAGLRAIMDTDDSIGRRLFHEVARDLYQRFEESIADAHGHPTGNYLQ